MNTLQEKFEKEIKKDLLKKLEKGNVHAVPTLAKITVNMGIGRFKDDKQYKESCIRDLEQITGQKPQVTKSKKSIASFKLRKGEDVGVCVTLRGVKMWDFFQNLVCVVLPRVRDFRGISKKSFDGHGNCSIGFREHLVFPTIDSNKIEKIKSLQVVITTTASNDSDGYLLLKALGIPFKKELKPIKNA
ncbi:MAG: 50S ribosomal protein L5 [Patescibacteria group bacterium]